MRFAHKPCGSVHNHGLTTLIVLVVSGMIGSGVFTTTGHAVETLGSTTAVLAAWLLAGVIAICGAIGYATIATLLPSSGGEYLYLSRRFHPFVGFLAGWVSLTAGFSGSIALAAKTCETYVRPLLGVPTDVPPQVLASVIVITCGIGHAFIGMSATLCTNTLTILKMLAIGLFIAFGFASLDDTTPQLIAESHHFSLGAFASTVMWISFSYAGFNQAVYIASEAKEPEKNIPRALLAGTLITTVAYMLLNYLFLQAGPLENISGQDDVAAIAAGELGGTWLETSIRGIIAMATLTSVAGMMMTGPRVYAQMSEDGVFPNYFSGDRGISRSVLLQMSTALVLVHCSTILELLRFMGVTLSMFSALAVATIWTHHPAKEDSHRRISCGARGAAALFIVSTICLIALMLIHDPRQLAGTACLLVVGSALWQFRKGKRHVSKTKQEQG